MKRRFKVEANLFVTYEIVVDDAVFNKELAESISDDFHEIDFDDEKPPVQALVEDVAELYLRSAGDGSRMEPYGEIAEEGNKYQVSMSEQGKDPYCKGITIRQVGADFLEITSKEVIPGQ